MTPGRPARRVARFGENGQGMERKDGIDAFGAVALIGFSMVLGFNQVIIKVVNEGFQPVFWAGLRSVIAVACLWGWMVLRGRPPRITRATLGPGILIGLIFAVEFLLLFIALDLTTVTRASVIFYSMPVWLSIAGHFLLPGERLTRRKSLGLALAFAGVGWAILDRGAAGGAGSLAGDLCALGAALSWAALPLCARLTAMSGERADMQIFWQVLVSAPVLLAASLFFGPLLRDPGLVHFAGLGVQAVLIVSASYVFWFWLLSVYPANAVASFSFLTPVLSVMMGWLILGETIGPVIIASLVLVSAGIVLINRPARRPPRV